MANWSIYQAQGELTKISRENGKTLYFLTDVEVPLQQVAAKKHKFMLDGKIFLMKKSINDPGETVEFKFGTIDSLNTPGTTIQGG